MLFRGLGLDSSQLDVEEREVSLSFSSEQGVARSFYDQEDGYFRGNEYLKHDATSADLSRLGSVGSVFFNHDPNRIIGPVRSAGIDPESKKGLARIAFDDDEIGNMAMAKVKSGSLRGVSFGYRVEEFRKLRENEEWEGFRGPGIVATKWRAYEISLTPIPADDSVGVGRALDLSGGLIELRRMDENNKPEEKTMEKDEVRKLVEEMNKGLEERITAGVVAAIREGQKPKCRVDAEQMQDLLGRAGTVGVECKAKVADMIADGKNETDILRLITEANKQPADAANQSQRQENEKPKIDAISDEDFSRMVCNPVEGRIS